MRTTQRSFGSRVALFIGSVGICVGALAPVSDAAAGVSASIRVSYQGVVQASGQSFTADASGTVTFGYVGSGTFVTAGTTDSPPLDSLQVFVQGGTGCSWIATKGPTTSGSCGSSALVLGAGTHTIQTVAYDENGSTAQSAVFSLTVVPPPAPVLSVAPTSINFGSVSVSQTSGSTTVVISNTGKRLRPRSPAALRRRFLPEPRAAPAEAP